MTALVHGQAVAVFRTHDGSVYALGNYDPFGRRRCWLAGSSAPGATSRSWPPDAQAGVRPAHRAVPRRRGRPVPTYDVQVISDGTVLVGDKRHDGHAARWPGYRIGITAARKVEEQVAAPRAPRRQVESGAGAVASTPTRSTTRRCARPPRRCWPADRHLRGDHRDRDEGVVRGRRDVGPARRAARGARRRRDPGARPEERRRACAGTACASCGRRTRSSFDDVLAHLRGRDLAGQRIVVQEHGQSLSMAAHALRRQGADVDIVTVYRVASADDPEPMFRLVDLIADRELDAVTFTSAPAVAALMQVAGSTGRRDEVVDAFQADVLATCVGPVTAAAFEMWGVPTIQPDRSRLAAMVKLLETELPSRDGRPDARRSPGTRCCCTATWCCSTASRCGSRRRRSRCCRRWSSTPATWCPAGELMAACRRHSRLRARGRDGGGAAARRDRHPGSCRPW